MLKNDHVGKAWYTTLKTFAIKKLHNKDVVKKLFDDIAKRNPERKGGYTRILKLDKTRLGDNASQVVFMLVDQKAEEAAPVEEKKEEAATANA